MSNILDSLSAGARALEHKVDHGATSFEHALTSAAGSARDTAGQVYADAKATASSFLDQAEGKAKDVARDAVRNGVGIVWHEAAAHLPKGTIPKALKFAEKAIDGVAKPIVAVAGKDSAVGKLANDFTRIDLEGICDNRGLKADWGKLWGTWLLEEKPQSLGTWDKHNGVDRVTVTDPAYTGDLASRQTQKDARAAFYDQHPNPKPGDTLKEPAKFVFTGEGTAHPGEYTALEWFTGSYETNVTCNQDPKTGELYLEYTVTNTSHWESGTRVPEDGQKAGFDDSLVPDRQRGQGFGLGGDFEQRYVWREPVDPPTS